MRVPLIVVFGSLIMATVVVACIDSEPNRADQTGAGDERTTAVPGRSFVVTDTPDPTTRAILTALTATRRALNTQQTAAAATWTARDDRTRQQSSGGGVTYDEYIANCMDSGKGYLDCAGPVTPEDFVGRTTYEQFIQRCSRAAYNAPDPRAFCSRGVSRSWFNR